MTHNLTWEIVICLPLFYYLSIEIWILYGPSSVAKTFRLEVDKYTPNPVHKFQSLRKLLMLVAFFTVPRYSWLSACFLLLVAFLL